MSAFQYTSNEFLGECIVAFSANDLTLIGLCYPPPQFVELPLQRLADAIHAEACALRRSWVPALPVVETDNDNWMLMPTAQDFINEAKKQKMQSLAAGWAKQIQTPAQ